MQMPGRGYTGVSGYRYGFNGKESDGEVSGDGNQYDYGFRIYNPRLGRFLSVDPLTQSYPMLTPYQFASNTPIMAIDLDGLEAIISTQNCSYDAEGRLVAEKPIITAWDENDVEKSGPLGKGIQTIQNTYVPDNSLSGVVSFSILTKETYTKEVICEEDKYGFVETVLHDMEGVKARATGDTYGEWEGDEAGQKYIDNVGKAGEVIDEVKPFLVEVPVAYEVADILSKALNGGKEFMQTARDIDIYGLDTGLQKSFDRAVENAKTDILGDTGATTSPAPDAP